jgi:hypothetical protein
MAEIKGLSKSTTKRELAKPRSPITIDHETTTELEIAPQGELEEIHSKTFLRKAQRLDEKIISTIDRVEKDIIVLGEMFDEMQSTGYHRALGFGMFPDYLKARYPDRSRTQIFQAMRIVRVLTSGPSPAVSKDDVREMSRDNAEGLARMKKQGREITAEHIAAAKTLPAYRFRDEIVEAQLLDIEKRSAPTATAELEVEVQVKRVFYIAGTTNSNLEKAIEIILFLGEGHERDRSQSKDDYIVGALVGDFLASYAKDYEEMKRVRNAEAVHAATLTEDAIGPEPAESPEDDEEDPEEENDEDDDDSEDDDEEGKVKTSAAEATVISICEHIKGDGLRCQSPTLKNSRFCFFHKKHYGPGKTQPRPVAAIQ